MKISIEIYICQTLQKIIAVYLKIWSEILKYRNSKIRSETNWEKSLLRNVGMFCGQSLVKNLQEMTDLLRGSITVSLTCWDKI